MKQNVNLPKKSNLNVVITENDKALKNYAKSFEVSIVSKKEQLNGYQKVQVGSLKKFNIIMLVLLNIYH